MRERIFKWHTIRLDLYPLQIYWQCLQKGHSQVSLSSMIQPHVSLIAKFVGERLTTLILVILILHWNFYSAYITVLSALASGPALSF